MLSLAIGQVYDGRQVRSKIGIAPRDLKGHYGSTRWVPVVPELRDALETYLARRSRHGELRLDAPLFVSRVRGTDGQPRAIGRSNAGKLLRKVFAKAGVADDGRLGTHSLRKSFASRVYDLSGHDMLLTRDALGHSSVSVTERYLEVDRDRLDAIIAKGDWTRRRRPKPSVPREAVAPLVPSVTATAAPAPDVAA